MYETTIYSPSAPGGIQVESRWKAPYLSSSFASSLSFKRTCQILEARCRCLWQGDRRLTWHFLMKYLWILWSIWFVISHDFWCHIVYLYLSDFQIQTISKLLTSSHLQQHIFASSQLHDTFCLSPMAHGSHLVIWSGVTAVSCHGPMAQLPLKHGLKGLSCEPLSIEQCACIISYIYIYHMIHILFSALVQVACETSTHRSQWSKRFLSIWFWCYDLRLNDRLPSVLCHTNAHALAPSCPIQQPPASTKA